MWQPQGHIKATLCVMRSDLRSVYIRTSPASLSVWLLAAPSVEAAAALTQIQTGCGSVEKQARLLRNPIIWAGQHHPRSESSESQRNEKNDGMRAKMTGGDVEVKATEFIDGGSSARLTAACEARGPRQPRVDSAEWAKELWSFTRTGGFFFFFFCCSGLEVYVRERLAIRPDDVSGRRGRWREDRGAS